MKQTTDTRGARTGESAFAGEERKSGNKGKTYCVKASLGKGEMNLYDFGSVRLHAYRTNDAIDDEVFIFSKNGRAVVLESPCFYDNERELESYLEENGLVVEGMLLAYHMGGGAFLKDVKKYATKNADEYGRVGGGKRLIDGFAQAFGPIFDASIHNVTDIVDFGKMTIGGIEFVLTPTDDAFDVEIPEINAVYTHMLGHDCHSIIAGSAHADAMIEQLRSYLDKNYDLVLTSHYTPEDLKDVATKIDYISELKRIAAASENAEQFKTACKERFPAYGGEHYLDLTAGFFFQ